MAHEDFADEVVHHDGTEGVGGAEGVAAGAVFGSDREERGGGFVGVAGVGVSVGVLDGVGGVCEGCDFDVGDDHGWVMAFDDAGAFTLSLALSASRERGCVVGALVMLDVFEL